MNQLQSANYFLNQDHFRRPQITQTICIQSKSAIDIKPQPILYQKKQKTIHYYDQGKKSFEQYTTAKTKLYELLSLRQSMFKLRLLANRAPIQRQIEPKMIVRRQPEMSKSIIEQNDISNKVKTQSCPRTQQKIAVYQHSSQLISTQKRQQQNSKSFNNNTSTPILNKTVSQFSCFTPIANQKNPIQQELMQRIKQQKIESFVNLLLNNQIKKKVACFGIMKQQAPMLSFIKELERKKAEFKPKKFQIQLIKIK